MNSIIIVDDEDKRRKLIKMNLEFAGYKCYMAKDDKESKVLKTLKDEANSLSIENNTSKDNEKKSSY